MSNLNKYSVGGLATVHEQTGATSQQPTPSAAGQTQFHRPIAANNNNNNNYPSYGQAYHIQPPTNEMEMGGDGDDSDDGETGMMGGTGNTQGSASGGKTRAGRRKILIQYIEDKGRRHITFSKRKAGIMKKAYELSTLTGTQVLLLVASETGHVYTFATPKLQPLITKPEGKNLIQACLNAPDHLSVPPNATDYGHYEQMEEGGGGGAGVGVTGSGEPATTQPRSNNVENEGFDATPVNAQAAAAVAAANYAAALAGMTAAGYGSPTATSTPNTASANGANQLSAAAYAAAYNQAVAAGYWPQQAAQQAAAAAAAASGLYTNNNNNNERPSLSPSPAQLAAAAAAASYYQHHQLQQHHLQQQQQQHQQQQPQQEEDSGLEMEEGEEDVEDDE